MDDQQQKTGEQAPQNESSNSAQQDRRMIERLSRERPRLGRSAAKAPP